MAAGVPTSLTVEVNLSGSTWTDISTSVRSWSIKQGSEDGSVAGGQLNLTLDNFDGRFLPDNATATYYPNFVEGKAIRFTAVKGASTSTRFFGWITGIEPDYPSEQVRSVCQVTALDTIGILSRSKLKPMPWAYAARAASSDDGFYPLTDRSARNGFRDVLGNMPNLTPRTGQTSGAIKAASDSSLPTSSEACVAIEAGRSIWHERSAFLLGSGGSIAFYVNPSAVTGTLMQLVTSGTDMFVLYDATNRAIVFNTVESVSSPLASVDAEPGQWHSVMLYGSGPGVHLVVDGTDDLSLTPLGGIDGVTRLEIGTDATFSIRDLWIAPTTAALGAPYTISSGIQASNLTGERNYLNAALNISTDWTSGGSDVCAGLQYDRVALDALAALVATQSGIAFCSYTSTTAPITLVHRDESRPTTVALTVDAELDALGGPSVARGLAQKVAEVTVTSTTGENVVRDLAAAAALDSTTLSIDTAAWDDNARRAIGQDILAQSQNAKQRITAVTLDLVTATTDRYSAFFNLTLGERVRVSNLSSAYFGITYWDGYVTGWTEEGDNDRDYRVTLSLTPADAPPEGYWGDSTYGRWGFGDGICTVTGGTAVGTTSTGTMTLTWTGSATLSTSAGDYPMDFDWNGERVTVTSAPAGGTSPRTLTITARGVAPTVARSHAANEPIDIWNAARWAK